MDQSLPKAFSFALHRFFGAFERLEPIVEWTVLIGPEYFLERYIVSSRAQVFLTMMLACYPFGLIMHLLPYGRIRHAYSFVVGSFLLQSCWGIHWIHTPVTCLISYAMLRLCPRDKVQQVVPTFVMFYLGMAHFQHQYTVTNVLGLDIYFTASHMILTQKIYMLAYNLHDGYLISTKKKEKMDCDTGRKQENDPTKSKADQEAEEALKAAQSCAQYALSECPSLLEFLGYTFCFSNVLVGPSYEYSYYRSACDGSNLYITKVNKNDGTTTRVLRGKQIPSNILPTLGPLFKAFLMISFASIFDRACNYRRLLTPWFHNLTAKQKHFYNWLTNFINRFKVYFTWCFAEGSNNIWYAGFNGYDEDGNSQGFTISRGADILQLETCESIKVGTKAWNTKTSQWLLKYVYIRNKNRLGIVYAVSAIWHGFFPGYYMLAVIIWLMSQCERLGRRKISPYFSPKKWSFYGVSYIVVLHSLGSYATTAFFLRSAENVMDNWRSHNYWGHIVLVLYYVIVSQFPDPPQHVVASCQAEKKALAQQGAKLELPQTSPHKSMSGRLGTATIDTMMMRTPPKDPARVRFTDETKYHDS
ncbi:bound O-acyltransferase domain-containing protein 2 [Seminavis robusta]|uniref:Bound O-acyltransferase domain-containing protein 2 n=1 Tax=Seminavis robusta TaxID=568900 RepID=A0A9N8EGZ3_9STRA|nr:bound O-acyltransferase domain-containing protein 2 [Seminavis robusta]|eukprot:Sro1116_g242920.1 bound O-acyltransferase domain-containing protein 2 (586) ;mRNA; r:27616-29479